MKRIGKIININQEQNDVTILIKSNNQTVHYPLNSVNFTPMVDDVVEIIEDGENVIIGSYKEDILEVQPGKKR
ncbi:hypothetical protein [Vagococcus hydrophili]|uniref:Uncharacterized protein n=1 Tax=Vagococcus hydrophili TaxID=2714947 RepID=A0A6G8ATV5_9ENTE|nr:hypothetical protein [Vagococcus hydrophili]QIL48353.1 hypothetical protein G7082_07525 [Vagococcus hydrophili]